MMQAKTRPAVLITRTTFPDIANQLREHFELSENSEDTIWSPSELIARLQGKVGVMSTGSERIDAKLLDACPELKAVCNVGVGWAKLAILKNWHRMIQYEGRYGKAKSFSQGQRLTSRIMSR